MPRASCPTTGEVVLLPDDIRNNQEMLFPCGHRHRATFEFGAWALE
ncbi:MAG: hypothetical protein HY716_08740 [Planctomycetes bacterium]|nr:hypothetical protein [Planctomycetota bacterium]